ncbi:MAG: hypothetical protein AAF690_25555 [Acidobacteriota bacterium]
MNDRESSTNTSREVDAELRTEIAELSALQPPGGSLERVLAGAHRPRSPRRWTSAVAAAALLTAVLALWPRAEPPNALPDAAAASPDQPALFRLTNDGGLVLLSEGDQVLSIQGDAQ